VSAEAKATGRSVIALVAQVGTVVTVVSGIVSLVFVFRPGCQPQPGPDRAAAAISDVTVERGVSFGQYLQRLDYPAGTLSRDYLGRKGVLVQFHFKIDGFKGKPLPLQTQLINDDTHDLVGSTVSGISLTPGTNAEEGDWFAWSVVPKTRHRYHVVVTIKQPDGNVDLRAFPTPRFKGLAK
jgi:hypothetical protein